MVAHTKEYARPSTLIKNSSIMLVTVSDNSQAVSVILPVFLNAIYTAKESTKPVASINAS